MSVLNMFPSFFQDKSTGAAPYDASALTPAAGTPSIYASAEEWAAYRSQQEALAVLTAEASLGSGRGGQGGPTAMQLEAMLFPNTAGAGRGSVNPANVVPDSPSSSSSIAPVPSELLKSDGSRDIYGVNAAEGGNRVNKNTAEFGVKATQDAKGNVTLTNVGVPTGSYLQGNRVAAIPNVSNDLFSSITNLRNTNDPDTARGLLSNIRESAAQKMASIQSEAMNFASTKLGVPFLETQLREAEVSDRAVPGWYPGIGDSPGTARIRQVLLTTRASVDNEAKNYLMSNTSFASMGAALKTAEEEAKRIERIQGKTDTLETNLALRAEQKRINAAEEAETIKASLNPEAQARLIALNPSIAMEPTEDKRALAFAASVKRVDSDPDMKEALSAPLPDLPILAMAKNAHALKLVISAEVSNPGSTATPETVQFTLDKIAKEAGNPGMIDKAMRAKYGAGWKDNDDAKIERSAAIAGSVGLTSDKKQLKYKQDFAMALDLYRGEATARFMGDASQWGIQDPTFLAAVDEAKKITGRATTADVLTAYMKNAPPENLLARVQAIQGAALAASRKVSSPLFGSPDEMLIKNEIAARLRDQGIWSKISAINSRAIDGGLAAIGLLIPQGAENPLIDPVTGQLRQQ